MRRHAKLMQTFFHVAKLIIWLPDDIAEDVILFDRYRCLDDALYGGPVLLCCGSRSRIRPPIPAVDTARWFTVSLEESWENGTLLS